MSEKTLSILVERYRELIRVLHELASNLNTDQLMKYIVDAATQLTYTGEAWIFLPDQIKQILCLESGHFTNDEQYKGHTVTVDSSLEGWVFINQQPVMLSDVNSYDNCYGDLIRLPGVVIKSMISVPLSAKGKHIGILEVANKHIGMPTELDLEILQEFAIQAAICINNSHHFLQTDLLSELVHELRTPLAALNTSLNLLERNDLPIEKHKQIHEIVQTEFDRLTDLTTSFLDYARLESGREKFKLTRFDLIQLIRDSIDVMQIHAYSKGLAISQDLPDKPILLTADKDKVKQVILNLLNNAILNSHEGGKISISTNNTADDISFYVQDDGPGIPPESLFRIFDRFYRAPNFEEGYMGSGLGLTICKQIIDAHKGKIDVSSVMGKGTTFTVQLPIQRGI